MLLSKTLLQFLFIIEIFGCIKGSYNFLDLSGQSWYNVFGYIPDYIIVDTHVGSKICCR